MAHFAKLDENDIVIDVNVVTNECLDLADEENLGIEFLKNWSGGHQNWVQTSYNNKNRKQYAGIGFKYDRTLDIFIAPQPYPSWELDENYDWQSPIPKPSDGLYLWDEENQVWIETKIL